VCEENDLRWKFRWGLFHLRCHVYARVDIYIENGFNALNVML
jgi:hypothetical protein